MKAHHEITVLDLFHTSMGEIAILVFPNGKYPLVGMILKRDDGASWKIIGSTMGKPSDMTNAYKHLDPPRPLFSCNVKTQNERKNLEIGDRLTNK